MVFISFFCVFLQFFSRKKNKEKNKGSEKLIPYFPVESRSSKKRKDSLIALISLCKHCLAGLSEDAVVRILHHF